MNFIPWYIICSPAVTVTDCITPAVIPVEIFPLSSASDVTVSLTLKKPVLLSIIFDNVNSVTSTAPAK